jgi:predicted glycoside hydrolase/deacetylase ChbG (UPF0249 family)
MKRLIINADDFGFSREVTDGIIEAHVDGCVTSTTLMANMPAWEYAASLVERHPSLSVGIHLTLTQGRPVLPPERVPSLVDAAGRFKPYEQMLCLAWRLRLSRREIEAELSAQVERLLDAGVPPTHADSHHHMTMYPQPFVACVNVLRRHGIRRVRTHRCRFRADVELAGRPEIRRLLRRKQLRDAPKQAYYSACDACVRAVCRARMPDQRYGPYRVVSDHRLGWNADDWRRYLAAAPYGLSELTCHPGLRHEVAEDPPEFRDQRVRELEFLTDRETVAAIAAAGISLANFNDLPLVA